MVIILGVPIFRIFTVYICTSTSQKAVDVKKDGNHAICNVKVFVGLNRAPVLLIRYWPFTQEVEGSTPTGGTSPNDFSDPVDQDIRTQ